MNHQGFDHLAIAVPDTEAALTDTILRLSSN